MGWKTIKSFKRTCTKKKGKGSVQEKVGRTTVITHD